jgi:glycerophosphoryl diester phosphodiesterase
MVRRALLVVTALAGACGRTPSTAEGLCAVASEPGPAPVPLEEAGYVAHAGGSPYGLLQLEHYTNSREAFLVSYANGFRVFELDLLRLVDGTVIAAHDFDEHRYGLTRSFRDDATRDDVEGLRWGGQYDLLFGEDVIDLMVEHPDAWVILDTKWDHTEIARTLVALAPDDGVRDRMVPHLASEQHVAELLDVHRFPERMIAVYRWAGSDAQQLDRMARHGIDHIMMWWDSRWSEETQQAMDAAGRHVWVHTPADPAQIEGFRARGVGVYSNGWIPCGAPAP